MSREPVIDRLRLMVVRLVVAAILLTATACADAVGTEERGPLPIIQVETATTVVIEAVPEPDPVTLVLTYREIGGCDWAGPNCPTYQLWSDGTVEVMRTETLEADGDVEQTASIASSVPDKIRTLARDTDFDALLPTLPAGTCQACVDGIDVSLVIQLDEGEPVVIDSLTYEIPWDHPLFALIAVAREQMGEVAPLTIVSR